jgi:hypothetical protein
MYAMPFQYMYDNYYAFIKVEFNVYLCVSILNINIMKLYIHTQRYHVFNYICLFYNNKRVNKTKITHVLAWVGVSFNGCGIWTAVSLA